MSNFKPGDVVRYVLSENKKLYADVVQIHQLGNQMLINWHNNFADYHLVDQDRFELVND